MKSYLFAALAAFALLTAVIGFAVQAGTTTFAERVEAAGSAGQKGESGIYEFDPAHTTIGFRVKHFGLIEIPGYFRDFKGTVNYNADDTAKSSVEFTAKTASVDTGVAPRDKHLRTADFFDVEKHPEFSFRSSKVEKKGKGWTVTGDLTMKGVTKTISFPFQITGFVPGGGNSGPRMGITAETQVDRRDFGINYGSTPKDGMLSIENMVTVVLQIEAVAPKPEAGQTK